MEAALPPLRQDISILPTSPGPDGARRYLVHDPIRGAFHRISEPVMRALAAWAPCPPAAMLARAPHLSGEELEALTAFLARNRLFTAPPGGDPAQLARAEAARRRPWHEQILHSYLFIRIPLFRPQALLDRLMPWVGPWLRPGTAWTIAALGLLGTVLAVRQWESFVTTFLYFFTAEGLLFYGLTLVVLKALHELGHAVAARHYGAHVPIIGLAFLVMFPILYTDTTDAYRIPDTKKRAVIDAAGMIVELSIAALALLLWSVLPDGPLRSAAFFAATTSWTMSLFVNLNPCMRFDGYYLIQDLLGLSNLQARGFAYGRWHMRRTLLGVDEGEPDAQRPRLLLAYAYATWVYRFFLFVGIAVLVHHLFPKAIGIVLFVAEIGMFIVRPVWAELKHWWSLRMTILRNRRGLTTLAVLALGTAALCTPWQGTVRAPALLQPAQATTHFAPEPATVRTVHVQPGDTVAPGDILLTLASEPLDHALHLARLRLALAEAELAKEAADRVERASGSLRREQLREARASVAALEARRERLTLRAAFAGTVQSAHPSLQPGLGTTPRTALLRVVGEGTELVALPRERDAHRLQAGAQVRFVPDRLSAAPQDFTLHRVAVTAEAQLEHTLLAAPRGGRLAVSEAVDGSLVPDIPVVRATAVSSDTRAGTQAGIVLIEAHREAPIARVWERVVGVLLRETDF